MYCELSKCAHIVMWDKWFLGECQVIVKYNFTLLVFLVDFVTGIDLTVHDKSYLLCSGTSTNWKFWEMLQFTCWVAVTCLSRFCFRVLGVYVKKKLESKASCTTWWWIFIPNYPPSIQWKLYEEDTCTWKQCSKCFPLDYPGGIWNASNVFRAHYPWGI